MIDELYLLNAALVIMARVLLTYLLSNFSGSTILRVMNGRLSLSLIRALFGSLITSGCLIIIDFNYFLMNSGVTDFSVGPVKAV